MSAAPKMESQIKIHLVIIAGPHMGQKFSFSKKEITIGRSPENDVVLINDPMISRVHACVQVSGNDVEVKNLSQKNSILVDGENVQLWKLVNDAKFTIGDTIFQIQFDLGQNVIQIKPKNLQAMPPLPTLPKTEEASAAAKQKPPSQAPKNLPPKVNSGPIAKAGNNNLQPRQNQVGQPKNNSYSQQQKSSQQRFVGASGYTQGATNSDGPQLSGFQKIWSDPKQRFYLIVGTIIAAAVLYLNFYPEEKKSVVAAKETLLKYEDEVAIKLNSKSEKEEDARIGALKQKKEAATTQRAEENFIKGMRDFQLGNFARAMEYFQVVRNLDSDHKLASRYLYLSKVRFDEVLKVKLLLGESYFQKHNFRMCQSLYEQVIEMLEGKSNDQNYQLAVAMSKKCENAALGFR